MGSLDKEKLDAFHRKCLRRILKICWPGRISNQQLYESTATILLPRTIQGRCWKWLGPVLRKDNSSNIRTALTYAPEGKRRRERPKSTQRRTKTWGGTVGGRRRLLPATVVSGVFCCTASCVLQVMDRISNLIKVKRLSKTVCM